MTPRLRAHGVDLRRRGTAILHGVDLDVRAGEVVALVGPNGAGKSSLLAVLAGDLDPSAGEVLLDAHPIGTLRPAALARRRAVLPQQHQLAFPFSVRDVVRMGRAPWWRTAQAAEDDEQVERAIERTELTALAERPFRGLSGGEQARTAFARVLAQHTPTLLLDEPTAALDLRHQELLLARCREEAAAGAAVVVVLHDLGLAAAHADRICLISTGRVRACGTPHDVLTSDLLSEVYGQAVDVIEHAGRPLVVPRRTAVAR